jgi:antitoxin component YwqK of YwqJK toxin-antitoxin module
MAKKRATGDFKNGKPEGLMTYWYKNGQREMEGNFKGGKRNGQVIWWHENGQKKGEANFEDGEAISEKYWNKKGQKVDSLEEAKQ